MPGTKTIFSMRSGNKARLYFRYSKTEKGGIEKVGESNKDVQQDVIDNRKENYAEIKFY